MARKKSKNQTRLLRYHVFTRVNESVYQRLKDIQENSNCATVAEVARKILSKEKILCYYRDRYFDDTMGELSAICKELRAIGVNINQITRRFNSTKKTLDALKAADQYNKVGIKVDRLLEIVTELSYKWLPN